MNSLELNDYARQIDSVNASARALVDTHTAEELIRQAPNGGWSVVECLDHVAKTVAAYTPIIRAAIDDGRQRGLTGEEPFRYGLLARMFLWILEPPVRMRVKAPALFAPRPQPEVRATLDAYLAGHAELGRLILLAFLF